jgi:hypothetical protein
MTFGSFTALSRPAAGRIRPVIISERSICRRTFLRGAGIVYNASEIGRVTVKIRWILAIALFWGCAPLQPAFEDPNVVAQIHNGQTTKAEVETLLGTPTSTMTMTGANGLELWTYSASETGLIADVSDAFAGVQERSPVNRYL